MSSFTLEKELPSTRVNKQLVDSIESYLARRFSAITGTRDEAGPEVEAGRVTKITDELGIESLSSIQEFPSSIFPDSTTSIEIEFTRPPPESGMTYLRVAVHFHKERVHSRVRICCEGNNAKEFTAGIYQGILQCLQTAPARNGFFNPTPYCRGALGAIFFALLLGQVAALVYAPPGVALFLALVVLSHLFIWDIAPKMRPYTVFESDRANRNLRAWDWAFKGFLGFIVFGTGLTFLRDYIATVLN